MGYTREPPPWFSIGDYRPDPPLTDRELAILLWARFLWRERLEEVAQTDPDSIEDEFEVYRADVQPVRYREYRSSAAADAPHLPSGLGSPLSFTLDDVTDRLSDLEGEDLLAAVRVTTDWLGLNLLAVDASETDDVLLSAFKEWLVRRHAQTPAPSTRRGPKGVANKAVAPKTIDRWREFEILAAHDIDLYLDLTGRDQITRKALCLAVKPDFEDDPERFGGTARDYYRAALKAVQFLLSQTNDTEKPD